MSDDDKATNPAQIERQTWVYVVRRTIRSYISDGCVDAAAALTFFAVLGIFPAALAFVALIGVLGDAPEVLERLLSLLDVVAPAAVTETLRPALTDITDTSSAPFTLIVSIAVALWSASVYVSAFGRVTNRIYGVDEGRPFWKRKPAQLALTVGLVILVMIVAGVVVLSGPIADAVGDIFNIGDTALRAWNIVKWPILAGAVVVLIAVLYKGTGNVKPPPFRWLGLGALLAIVSMGIASAGFAVYLATFADYNRTFGALAGVIIFLIWLFLINLALLLGVEFNAELERGRQLQAGVSAEEQLQLPRRDTSVIERRDESDRVTLEHGVLIREGETVPARSDTALARLRQRLSDLWKRFAGRFSGN